MNAPIAPMVPPEVNLRGLPWMRLDTARLLDSDLFALSTGDEFKAAVALWCKSWTQEPAGSLPTDDRVLAHLSGAGPRWKKVRAMALRGWVLAEDGRLYHPVVAEQVLAAWEERQEYRAEKEGQNLRQARLREERSALMADLKAAGVHLAWNAPIGEVRSCHASLQRPVTPLDTDLQRTCHGDSHGLDGTGRDGSISPDSFSSADTTSRARAEPPPVAAVADPEAWDAFVAHHRQLGRWSTARAMTAQGQLRALAAAGADTAAVLRWATLRGLSDLADCHRRMQVDAAKARAEDRQPGESLADASYRRSTAATPQPVQVGALTAALLGHDSGEEA